MKRWLIDSGDGQVIGEIRDDAPQYAEDQEVEIHVGDEIRKCVVAKTVLVHRVQFSAGQRLIDVEELVYV